MSPRPFLPTTLLALASVFAAPLAFAQADETLEEIIVTANFRDATLMETVGSVSVVTQNTITERAAQHLQDILNAAPNVTWTAGASRGRFVQIRGVGDLEQFYDPKYYPAVGILLDDMELGDTASAGMLFDIAQVEVLRGPQGTRFGANGHGGMVFMRSNAPTDEFEAELSGGAGNYDSSNLGLVVSGPLSSQLSGRLAIQQNNSDGYIDNDRLDRDDTNDLDEFTSRARLRWTPSDTAQYDFSASYFDADNGYDTWSLDNDRTTFTDQPGRDTQKVAAFIGAGDWTLGDTHTVDASLSYRDADLHQSYDADWASDALCELFACAFGVDTASEIFDRDNETWVADVRLLGSDGGHSAGESRYVIGLYANDGTQQLDYQYPSAVYGDTSSSSDYDTNRYAIYGEYEYSVSSQLTLIAGLRLERFEDDYKDSNGFASDNNDNLWGGEVSLRYALDDNTMTYATIARSQKPGGVNTRTAADRPFMSPAFQVFTQDKLTFDDETLINHEIGLRTEQFDQRLALSVALFYAKRDSAQLENWMWDADSGLWIGYLDSAGDTSSYGAELETSFTVNNHVQLYANLGWLDTEVDSIETFDLDLAQFVTKKDRDQAKSPAYQYNVGTRLTLTESWSGHLEIEGQDDNYFGYYHDGELDSYKLINASLRWQSGAYAVTLWGRNLGDEDYAVHGLYFGNEPRDDFGAFQNQTYLQPGEPLTYGVELLYSF